MHGGVAQADLGRENAQAVRAGCVNLERHLRNVRRFGIAPVVAVNRFTADTEAELDAVREAAAPFGAEVVVCSHWADGGAGTEALARKVVEVVESGESDFRPLYPDDMPLMEKIRTVAREIYDAADIAAEAKVRRAIDALQDRYGHYPVCMAKTQYSFSTDPGAKGAPSGHVVPIREVRLAAGAEFVVVVCGEIMTMPGLPRVPAANNIRLNAAGQIEGLF
jgi:formate--tetrahydrofolate ligase